MEFKHTLVWAQEAHQLAASEPADLAVRFAIIDAINDAIDANTFTATVVVSGPSELIRLVLLDELNGMGYTIDGTTTPGSWIITW
jgi:lysozyme family protein